MGNLEWSLPVPSVQDLGSQHLETIPTRYLRDDMDGMMTSTGSPSHSSSLRGFSGGGAELKQCFWVSKPAMDYEPYDSSGTDDDLPPSHQNRIPRGGRVAGNGRPVGGSVPYSRMYGETDMETQIHQLEQEAYSSVLRAFKAQADAITWVKLFMIQYHSPTVSASRKKQKMTSSIPSQSFGPKGKKQKPGLPGASSMKSIPYPSSGPSGRGQVANRLSSGAGRHALVYDMGTANETWEWVNLSEISPEDIQWVDEDPGISHRGNYGGSGHGINRSMGRDGGPGPGRGRNRGYQRSIQERVVAFTKWDWKEGCPMIYKFFIQIL
ncbi:hypothetical protein D5086_007701 [Populus alba]|uniref:Uncharacterized protein n=1 Tax=Populus alba TaxID=43335 RepID=A0ACC4CES7_POPAL